MGKDLAISYLEEAKEDLSLAERFFKEGNYPKAAFFAQQCAEKAVKALLEYKMFAVRNHGITLISLLRQFFISEWDEELEFLAEALEFLHDFYALSRYPIKRFGKVYRPRDLITKDLAEKALEYARRTLEIVERRIER